MAAERAAFCSSVSFGMPKASLTTLNASVSRSITSSRRALRALPFFSTSAAYSANSAYFLRPCVRLPTMAVSAAPMEPASAATEPPPGAGASDATVSTNWVTVISASFMTAPQF